MPEFKIPYEPQPRQRLLHASTARQIFYGGAAGGGKSVSLRWDGILFCLENPGCQVYLFRRTLPELRKTHIDPLRAVFPESLGLGKWHEEQKAFKFVNGSSINMCYCEAEEDVKRYLSEEMHVVLIDEASTLYTTQIAFIKTRNRLGSWKPTKDAHRLPRFVMGSNPGGPSHSMLKRTFIDKAPPETLFYDETMRDPDDPEDKGWLSVFIPAKMTDNKYIDKGYRASFGGLSPDLAKAYRDGNWDVIAGQAIHNLSRERHYIRPFTPPKHWTKFQVMDWGTAKPFSIGWYCVSDGGILKAKDGYPERVIPTGAIIRYNELYGWAALNKDFSGDPEDKGCRWSANKVASAIVSIENERKEKMDYRVADGEMWAMRGGPTVMSYFEERNLYYRRAIKDRRHNYQEVLSRLAGNDEYFENEVIEADPMLFATSNCIHFWRTLPTLTFDPIAPEKGPNTKSEDHVYDEVAYACRSMSFVTTKEEREDAEYEEEYGRFSGINQDPYATA